MADDDVLELEDELIEQIEEPQDDDPEPESDDETSEEEETLIDFGSEEAAPASENDSSVIRDMRKTIREQAKELADLRKSSEPKPVEVGPEPTLESCEYDEDKFKTEWQAWNQRKSKAEAQKAEAEEADKQRKAAFAKQVEAYEAEKATLGIANFDEVEAEVNAALPPELSAAILHTDKPAALIAALGRSPDTLEQLSKLSLPKALMMLGKLEDKVQVRKSKKNKPQPDQAIQGKSVTGSDATLKRLEREAEKTGNRTELIRYRRKLQA